MKKCENHNQAKLLGTFRRGRKELYLASSAQVSVYSSCTRTVAQVEMKKKKKKKRPNIEKHNKSKHLKVNLYCNWGKMCWGNSPSLVGEWKVPETEKRRAYPEISERERRGRAETTSYGASNETNIVILSSGKWGWRFCRPKTTGSYKHRCAVSQTNEHGA